MLASLGVASAQAVLWACGAPAKPATRRPTEVNPELRTWLRDAVATLRGAGLDARVVASSRQRTTGAMDVLGAGVARARCDCLVISVRERDGMTREQMTNDLSRDGIMTAVRVLAGKAKPASVDFGRAPAAMKVANPDPDLMTDAQVLARVGALAMRDPGLSSRIVYSAAVVDIDDVRVWSVAPGRDQQQRIVRVRKSITRVAWNGTRPVVSEAARAWSGGLDDQDLDDAEVLAAREDALALMTPRAFEEREHTFALEPSVTAAVIDATVHALLTASAASRPEVAKRLAIGADLKSPLLTLVEDPTTPRAYGGFAFDDAGEPAAPVTLIDRGVIAARIDRPSASHLRLAAGNVAPEQLLEAGYRLEGALGTVVDPASDRVVISVARAKEWLGGKRTGRAYADIEIIGQLSKLMTAVNAVSTQTKTIGIRDEVDGQPSWRSIEAPWVRASGMLRARRRAT